MESAHEPARDRREVRGGLIRSQRGHWVDARCMAMALGTTSSFKGRDVDTRMVGRELKVAAVVQGKIDQRGDMLIIDADLVNAATGAEVWQGRYRRHTEAQFRYRPQGAPSRRIDS